MSLATRRAGEAVGARPGAAGGTPGAVAAAVAAPMAAAVVLATPVATSATKTAPVLVKRKATSAASHVQHSSLMLMCLQEATAAAAHLCGAEDGQANNARAIAAVAAPNRVASGAHNGRGTRRWARGRATCASAAASASSHARSWASSRT